METLYTGMGVHTPKQTEIYFWFFNAFTNLNWDDSSWVHDEGDSLWNEEHRISIMLPINKDTMWFYVTKQNEQGEEIYSDTFTHINKLLGYIYEVAGDFKNLQEIRTAIKCEILKLETDEYYWGSEANVESELKIGLTIENEYGYEWEKDDDAHAYFAKATNVEIWKYYLQNILPKLNEKTF